MIPKKIFYVWGVNDPKKRDVLACIQSWRQVCKDYEIIEINEDSKQYFDFQAELQNNKWFKAVYDKKMWAYVADYIRIKTLYDNGGIYLDTDVSVLKTFDKFLKNPAFVGIQSSGTWNYTEPAILGAEKHNSFLKSVLDFYSGDIWDEPIFTMPQIFEKFLVQKYNLCTFPEKNKQCIIKTKDIVIYPERYFIPFEFGQQFTPECIEEDTHTIHWFGGSWCKPEILFWLKNKHLKPIPEYKNEIVKTYYTLVFDFIPLLKIKIKKIDDLYKIYILLLNFIPLLKIRNNNNCLKTWLFFFIPMFLYKTKDNKSYLNLFNFIPLIKIKRKKYE